MEPKISIITVVWNDAAGLQRTLENLTGLDYPTPKLELVVIDGGSTDGTAQVIERYRSRLGYAVSEPDKGLYDAMNKGIRAATGDYLWFINAGDTVYAADTLRRIFPAGSAQPLCDAYYGDTLATTPEGRALGLRKKMPPQQLTWRSLLHGMVVCHQSFLIRRNLAPEYDPRFRLAADIDWMIRSLRNAASICHTGLILSRFPVGGLSSRRRRASLRERWAIMVEHYGLRPALWAHLGFLCQMGKPPYRPLPADTSDKAEQ